MTSAELLAGLFAAPGSHMPRSKHDRQAADSLRRLGLVKVGLRFLTLTKAGKVARDASGYVWDWGYAGGLHDGSGGCPL